MRSLLIVPAGDAAALAAALASGADALSVETAPPPRAGGPAIYVRAPPPDAPDAAAALAAAVQARARGIHAATANGADVQRLGARLAVAEALAGLDDGATRILASVAESAGAVLDLASYRAASARLDALAFTVAPLDAALRVAPGRREAGPLQLARNLTLIAARATGALALDAPFPDADDLASFEAEARAAFADGFDGKAAVDSRQVALIHTIFRRA